MLLDRLIKLVFFLGLVFLAFSGGVLANHFQWWPATLYQRAFTAYSAQSDRDKEVHEAITHRQQAEQQPPGRVVRHRPGKALEGYTFMCRHDGTPVLMDMQGRIKHSWPRSFSEIWPNPPHVAAPVPDKAIMCDTAYLYPNGDILEIFYAAGDTPYGYGLAKLDKDAGVIWTYDENTHHDLYVAGDGRIYVLTQAFREDPIEGAGIREYPVLVDDVRILSPDGVEQERISIMGAFIGSPFEAEMKAALRQQYTERLPKGSYKKYDITHANSVMALEPGIAAAFPQFAAGDILVSIKNMNMLAVIDAATHKVKWAMRNLWSQQHQARYTDNGHIMLFDNQGWNARRDPKIPLRSRVLEIDPRTEEVVWQYEGPGSGGFYTQVKGSGQQLPGGTIMVVESDKGRVMEITPDGGMVWAYRVNMPVNMVQRLAYESLSPEFCKQVGCP